jgi:RNA-directed DNA polymerase
MKSVSSTLSALRAKAGKDRKHRFRSLARLLDRQMLAEAFGRLRQNAAVGIDGVSYAQYEENLAENLTDLTRRLKCGQYRAQKLRRRWIPKVGSDKLRPLGIPAVEDKIVQQAVKMILEAIWESDFVEESIGYRPGRGAHQELLALRETLNDGWCRWVVEADIRGYFENIDHGWLVRMLEERIDDQKLIRLIVKWLKAGILEEDGRTVDPDSGTPQGGVISPVLANIYLHFVQDLWIKREVTKRCRGRVLFRRYADDSVVCFERRDDAEEYLKALPERLAKFHLELAAEKSSMVQFNRWEPDTSGKFTFLGFDFYWARTRRNPKYAVVKLRTTTKKFRASVLAMKEWIKSSRSLRLPDLLGTLRRKLQGYWNYYAIRGNSAMTAKYDREVKFLLFKWLNRRSQRRSFTWNQFINLLPSWSLPPPRINLSAVQLPLPWPTTPA